MYKKAKTVQELGCKNAETKVTYGPAVSKAPDEENIDNVTMLPTGEY